MDLQLSGKTALVTGSTAGIGLAIAKRLAAEGAGVTLVGRSREKLDEARDLVMAEAASQDACDALNAVLADVTTAEGAALLAQKVPDIDILINNLGIYESKNFAAITDDDWRAFFEVNVLSGVRLARQYFPGMVRRNWGRIVFIASDSAMIVPPDMIHYGMTKTAQLAVSRGLAALTKGTKVTVNAVLAGTTRSAGIVSFLKSVADAPDEPLEQIESEFFAAQRPTSLIQRMIEPEEIATMVAYVASPLSAATNGAALRVDGGITPTVF